MAREAGQEKGTAAAYGLTSDRQGELAGAPTQQSQHQSTGDMLG